MFYCDTGSTRAGNIWSLDRTGQGSQSAELILMKVISNGTCEIKGNKQRTKTDSMETNDIWMALSQHTRNAHTFLI